ncbi:hypothetical protein Mapa_003052 [Marchantia paleacea]|nr:hypothetical protein Mapa_003052 [Marchantia paleacea]
MAYSRSHSYGLYNQPIMQKVTNCPGHCPTHGMYLALVSERIPILTISEVSCCLKESHLSMR